VKINLKFEESQKDKAFQRSLKTQIDLRMRVR